MCCLGLKQDKLTVTEKTKKKLKKKPKKKNKKEKENTTVSSYPSSSEALASFYILPI